MPGLAVLSLTRNPPAGAFDSNSSLCSRGTTPRNHGYGLSAAAATTTGAEGSARAVAVSSLGSLAMGVGSKKLTGTYPDSPELSALANHQSCGVEVEGANVRKLRVAVRVASADGQHG